MINSGFRIKMHEAAYPKNAISFIDVDTLAPAEPSTCPRLVLPKHANASRNVDTFDFQYPWGKLVR